MSSVRDEALQLLKSPVIAWKELASRIRNQSESESSTADSTEAKVLIDKDGNATLNLNNAEVQAEMQKHIAALASIKVVKPESSAYQD